jgi:hypothetical protein
MTERDPNLTARTSDLIELGDIDGLLVEVDRLCDEGQWGALYRVRELCRRALQRGKQLWPVAAHAEYRLALGAPGPWAARMLEQGAGRFAFGPLPEVAASSHEWEELADDLPAGPVGAMAAHERVVRGEDLTGDNRVDRHVLELPLVLQPWEPDYTLAEYLPHEARFPTPRPVVALRPADVPPAPAVRLEEPETARALVELASAWSTESNGRAEAVGVAGGALEAIAALGVHRARTAEVDLAMAMAWMAWTAASGGAHGRRRGMAAGRFGAWWAVAALVGLLDVWPVPPDELEAASAGLRFNLWDAGEPDTGWSLRLAVEDPDQGVAWALSASDSS